MWLEYCSPSLSYLCVSALFILLWLHRKLIEHINAFSKAHMLAFCGLIWWKKSEYPEEPPTLDGWPGIEPRLQQWQVWVSTLPCPGPFTCVSYLSSEFLSSASNPDTVWTYSLSFSVICLSISVTSSRCWHFSVLSSFFNSVISLACFWMSSSTYFSSSLRSWYLHISCEGFDIGSCKLREKQSILLVLSCCGSNFNKLEFVFYTKTDCLPPIGCVMLLCTVYYKGV